MSKSSSHTQNTLLSYVFISLSLLGFSNFTSAESADRDKPIDLEADSVKVDDAKQISTYSGNVILTQGTLIIRAEKLIVREDAAGFQHSTAIGNPTSFKQKREGKDEYMEGIAQRIEYDGRMDKVQLFTRASVKRGEDIVQGDYISYDANAEYAEVIGGTKSADGTTSGRVHAVIQPKNKKTTTPTTEPAKPSNPNSSSSGANKDARLSRTLQVSPDAQ